MVLIGWDNWLHISIGCISGTQESVDKATWSRNVNMKYFSLNRKANETYLESLTFPLKL